MEGLSRLKKDYRLSARMKTISVFLCLLYAMWTEGADINVEGLERGEVSFQCSHKLAWHNNKYFCKDPCKDSKDKLVTVKSGGRAESGRITLEDLGNGDFTVTFSQLQVSDSGTYWCAVDRPGFDTFTEVHLTVNEAVTNETTTVMPEVSPTWPYQNISYSTQMPSGMDTGRPTNISTASNCTNGGEQNISTGTVLFATFSAVSALTILVLVMCFRKRRKNTKPQPEVCSTDTVSADKGQADCEYDEIGEEVQSLKKLRVSCSHHPKQDPPTSASAAAEGSVPFHIYENISHIKHTAGSRNSAANVQDDGSGIYVKPLPATIPERTGHGSRGKRTNKPTATRQVTNKPTESCARNASACYSRSRSDSKEAGPRSLWFGLDLSGTV